MNINQIRTATEKHSASVRALLEKITIGELEDLLEEMRSLSDEVETNLDRINEKNTLNDTQELRQSQYEELKPELDNMISELEILKSSLEDLEKNADMLDAIAEQSLYA